MYLINVPQLADSQWGKLAAYVEAGGGLGVIVGSDGVQTFQLRQGTGIAFSTGIAGCDSRMAG
ncbi:MAG: hypothetical protein R3B90_11070 [Planctomycetaceae bacterium]